MKKLISIVLLLLISSCGNDSKTPTPLIDKQQNDQLADLGSGTYLIACFYNKLASQGSGNQVYTKATMTLNADGTGSNLFEIYSDSSCTTIQSTGTVSILNYKTVIVNENRVFMMTQNDGSGPMDIWIGYKSVGGSYYFDVDYRDGESGPYITEPLAVELVEFMADPVEQGTKLLKLSN